MHELLGSSLFLKVYKGVWRHTWKLNPIKN